MSSTTAPCAPLVFGDPHLHTDGDILALAYDADGALWSVEERGVLRCWESSSGRPLLSHALSDLETSWRFSFGAKLLASGGEDVSIWAPQTGNLLNSIPQESWVTALAFHPRKALLASGHEDGTVRLWDLKTEKLLREYCRHDEAISALAFSSTGAKLATAAEDKRIALWQTTSGAHLADLDGHKDRIPALAWHPGGKILVSAGWDTTVRVWDVKKQEPIVLLNSHATQVWTLAFNPAGNLLASADSAQSIHLWNFPGYESAHVLEARQLQFRQLAFSPDGEQLAGGGEGRIFLWNPQEGASLFHEAGACENSPAFCLRPDGKQLAVKNGLGVTIYHTGTQKPELVLEEENDVHTLAWSPDKKIIAGGTDDYVRLWDARSGKARSILEGPKQPITTIAFSADGGTLAAAGNCDMAVWLFRVADGEPVLLIPDALDGCTVEALAFHPSRDLLAVGGIDPAADGSSTGAASIWNLKDRCEIATFTGGVCSLTFDKSGSFLVTGDVNGAIAVWNVEKKELAAEKFCYDWPVRALDCSPDGKHLASGGDDGVLHLWSTACWDEKAAYTLDNQIKFLAFSPNGKYLFTGAGNAVCYRLETQRLLARR